MSCRQHPVDTLACARAEGLLARAERNAGGRGDEDEDQVLTGLGQQLLEISLSASKRMDEEEAEGASRGQADVPAAGEAEEALPSEKELSGMKVAELKLLLQQRDLATSGRKSDLVARLLDSVQSGASARILKSALSRISPYRMRSCTDF